MTWSDYDFDTNDYDKLDIVDTDKTITAVSYNPQTGPTGTADIYYARYTTLDEKINYVRADGTRGSYLIDSAVFRPTALGISPDGEYLFLAGVDNTTINASRPYMHVIRISDGVYGNLDFVDASGNNMNIYTPSGRIWVETITGGYKLVIGDAGIQILQISLGPGISVIDVTQATIDAALGGVAQEVEVTHSAISVLGLGNVCKGVTKVDFSGGVSWYYTPFSASLLTINVSSTIVKFSLDGNNNVSDPKSAFINRVLIVDTRLPVLLSNILDIDSFIGYDGTTEVPYLVFNFYNEILGLGGSRIGLAQLQTENGPGTIEIGDIYVGALANLTTPPILIDDLPHSGYGSIAARKIENGGQENINIVIGGLVSSLLGEDNIGVLEFSPDGITQLCANTDVNGTAMDNGTCLAALADPHIKPLFGKTYTLPHDNVTFKYYDNNDQKSRIVINSKCWELPQEEMERLKIKLNNKLSWMDGTTYNRYVSIRHNDEVLVLDLDTLNPVEYTNEEDVTNHTLSETTFKGHNIELGDIEESLEGIRNPHKMGEFRKFGAAHKRTVVIDPENKNLRLTFTTDLDSPTRNDISMKLGRDVLYNLTGAMIRESDVQVMDTLVSI